MPKLKKSEVFTAEREREIQQVVESVGELTQIMKDLSVLVIDQGTLVDRIDYNIQNVAASVEEGFKQLQKFLSFSFFPINLQYYYTRSVKNEGTAHPRFPGMKAERSHNGEVCYSTCYNVGSPKSRGNTILIFEHMNYNHTARYCCDQGNQPNVSRVTPLPSNTS